jgi:hypothetical protein
LPVVAGQVNSGPYATDGTTFANGATLNPGALYSGPLLASGWNHTVVGNGVPGVASVGAWHSGAYTLPPAAVQEIPSGTSTPVPYAPGAVAPAAGGPAAGPTAEPTDRWFESVRPLGVTQNGGSMVVQLEVQGETSSGNLEYRIAAPDATQEAPWSAAKLDGTHCTAVISSAPLQLDAADTVRQLVIEARNPQTQQSAQYPYSFKLVLDVRPAN